MRIAVVYFSDRTNGNILALARGLADGLETRGHQVDVINGDADVNLKLTTYRYIVVGAPAANFWGGAISSKVAGFLASCGTVSGKRSFAFIKKGIFRNQKTLLALMKTMEHEGMFVKNSDIIASSESAKIIGSKLNIK